MSAPKTWCDKHHCPRVRMESQNGYRCPDCRSEYKRKDYKVKRKRAGKKPRKINPCAICGGKKIYNRTFRRYTCAKCEPEKIDLVTRGREECAGRRPDLNPRGADWLDEAIADDPPILDANGEVDTVAMRARALRHMNEQAMKDAYEAAKKTGQFGRVARTHRTPEEIERRHHAQAH